MSGHSWFSIRAKPWLHDFCAGHLHDFGAVFSACPEGFPAETSTLSFRNKKHPGSQTLDVSVPKEGIEPSFLAEHDFESCASAYSATSALAGSDYTRNHTLGIVFFFRKFVIKQLLRTIRVFVFLFVDGTNIPLAPIFTSDIYLSNHDRRVMQASIRSIIAMQEKCTSCRKREKHNATWDHWFATIG